MLHLQTYVSKTDYVMECLNNVMDNNKILNPIASLLFTGTVLAFALLFFNYYIYTNKLGNLEFRLEMTLCLRCS